MVLTSWESTHELCTYNTKLSNLPLGEHKGKRSIPLLWLLTHDTATLFVWSDTFNCQCDALASRFLFVFNCYPRQFLRMKSLNEVLKCVERNFFVLFLFIFLIVKKKKKKWNANDVQIEQKKKKILSWILIHIHIPDSSIYIRI